MLSLCCIDFVDLVGLELIWKEKKCENFVKAANFASFKSYKMKAFKTLLKIEHRNTNHCEKNCLIIFAGGMFNKATERISRRMQLYLVFTKQKKCHFLRWKSMFLSKRRASTICWDAFDKNVI